MIKKQQQFIPKGMNQDIAQTKVQSEFAHSIKNLRVVTDEKDGTLSLVTEKGTLEKQFTNGISYDITITTKPLYNINRINDTIFFHNPDYEKILSSDPVTIGFYYNYFVAWYSVKVTFLNETTYNNYKNSGRNYFPKYIDINSSLENISKKIEGYSGHYYRVTYDNNGNIPKFIIIIDETNDSNDLIYVYPNGDSGQSSNPWWQSGEDCFLGNKINDENKTIEFNIPVIDFRYVINNGLDKNSPCKNAELFINTAMEKWCNNIVGLETTTTVSLNVVLGNAVIENNIYLFGKCYDYKLDGIFEIKDFNSTSPYVKALYIGNLNFNINYPIQTYVSCESEEQQRIYWIDGLNQPRVINVTKHYEMDDTNEDNHFDFCSPIPTNQTVTILKNNFGGFFHSGVIQYFMTYVDQNDQESKIFYQSPLYYITDNDRGLSPDENGQCSFNIKISNIQNNVWLRKQIRCYSILRTSLDAVVVAKVVTTLPLNESTSTVNFVDTGKIGYNIDPQVLFALGCEEFIPQTFAVKNNNMFFGNVKIKDTTSRENFKNLNLEGGVTIPSDKRKIKALEKNSTKEFQLIGNDLSKSNLPGTDQSIKGFMFQEDYMLGLQFLHKNGSWSEPIWVCDKIMSESPSTNVISGVMYHVIPFFRKIISSGIVTDLVNSGYIQVRPLIVYNEYSDARVLCNGILSPTIEYTRDNITMYLSSWFFRPNTNGSITANRDSSQILNTRFITNGNVSTGSLNIVKNEVQGSSNEFKINQGYVTFNSPELEFEKINSISNNYKLFYSGFFPIHANKYDINITTSTTPHLTDGGFKHKSGQINDSDNINGGSDYTSNQTAQNAGQTFLGGYCWQDDFKYVDTNDDNEIKTQSGYIQIYPWENNTSYSGWPKSDDNIVYAEVDSKTITNWRISNCCKYVNTTLTGDNYDILSDIKLVNNSYIQLNNGSTYYKDVDILFIPKQNYSIPTTGTGDASSTKTIDYPTRIQYKSTQHLLLTLYNEALPCFRVWAGSNPFNNDTTYKKSGTAVFNFLNSEEISQANLIPSNLLQGTLINKEYDSNNTEHFSGRVLIDGVYKPTETSLNNCNWKIAGPSVKLQKLIDITVDWVNGDTYYQRYNCLKTYPYTHESKNNIIDLASVMIQTRVNIDGTYDKQKVDILHIEPENFNKLNDIYTQSDNFFVYRNITTKTNDNFKNTIFWTRSKNFGSEIDSWCNVHLSNSIDLNGNNGEITAIVNWNDNLLVFQNRAIYKLNYNENTVLSGQNGVPVVLQGSDKVTGATLVSGQFGCQNEWSIVNAKSGLYFSDDYNQKLYVLSDGIKCISDNLGFKSYLKTKNYTGTWKPNTNTWTLANGGTLHTFYDQQLGEIYFTDGEDCLTFNENLNLFTAFYDYKNDTNKRLFDFVNIENKNYWILNNFTSNVPIFYEHRAIDNLNIFDTIRDYSIELTSNIDPHLDKVFDTIEIRGDAYISNNLQSGYNIVGGVNTTSLPFDKLQVSNEYQDTGEQTLNFIKDKPYSSTSNMKQKFRIWRAAIGRNKKNNQNTRDRIRNYWSRIKLTKNGTSNLKAKIHDIVVDVYE